VRPISTRFARALGTSHKRVTRISCTVPGGEPIQIGQAVKDAHGRYGPGWTSGEVSATKSPGVRYSATLTVVPEPEKDTYGTLATPGAIFDIDHGIDFGAGDIDWVDCGVYEAVKGGVRITGGDISLTLNDQYTRVQQCRFTAPYSPGTGTRGSRAAAAVVDAIPGVITSVQADGGTYVEGNNVWDRDRTQFLTDMSTDGSLYMGFDAAGVWTVQAEPVLDLADVVWTFRTGTAGNIFTADRDLPLDQLYNVVIVSPIDDTQTWTRQEVPLLDEDHPRHHNKIGARPFFYVSPTLGSAEAAYAAGETILQRLLSTSGVINISALSNPALEPGDNIFAIHETTDTDPGLDDLYMIESWQMDLATGGMSFDGRASELVESEEAA
jgi:hypothetical protein